MKFTLGEAKEGERSGFGKWVLSLNHGSEMGDFEFANLIMELECKGGEGEGERFTTMASEEKGGQHRKWNWIIRFVI